MAKARATGLGFDKETAEEYHCRPMSAPQSIDSLRFARSRDCLDGEFAVASLTRLSELLVGDTGVVRYRLCGGEQAGRPALTLSVEATVVLRCQRCLAPYSQPVVAESVLPVARDEAQMTLWERDDPLLDVLLAEPHLDVRGLVEDEMLLSLPAVPRHPEGGCEVGAAT